MKPRPEGDEFRADRQTDMTKLRVLVYTFHAHTRTKQHHKLS